LLREAISAISASAKKALPSASTSTRPSSVSIGAAWAVACRECSKRECFGPRRAHVPFARSGIGWIAMFSLQTMFGKGDRFYTLLESSAGAARDGAKALQALLEAHGEPMLLDGFRAARRREKELAAQISEALVNTFVTALDREDIEAMSSALYRIPKTIEKFAERYVIVAKRVEGIDFASRAGLLMSATEGVVEMVGELRNGMNIGRMRKLQDRLQAVESEADRLLLEPYRTQYLGSDDPIRTMLVKDLFELLEKAIDRCRDVGNVIYSIVLKNS